MGCLSSKYENRYGSEQEPANSILPDLTEAWLLDFIDFDHGLLDELITAGVINYKKFEPFMDSGLNKDSNLGARLQLMNDVVNASTAQKIRFLSALDRTQQSHVTNCLRHKGQRPADTDDNWPLFEQRCVITEHLIRLINSIDVDCGFLDEIISAGILNGRQKAAVMAFNLDSRSKVNELLLIMVRKSVADYKKFIDCLVRTKQYGVLSILDPSTAATCPPLSEGQRAKLDSRQSGLDKLIDTRVSGLLQEILKMNCMTLEQKSFIDSTDNDSDRTRRLLDILRKGSQSDYYKFILCLGKTGQQHVVNFLQTDETAAVSHITARGTAFDKNQRYVIGAFVNLLQKNCQGCVQELPRQVSRALGPDNKLIFMKATRKINLFIGSRSFSGLFHLRDIYLNNQLKSSIQKNFSKLLQNKYGVIIDELEWDRWDYIRCVQHLAESAGLSFYQQIYEHSSDQIHQITVSSLPIDRLPHELIEMLLIKAAGRLFSTMKKITTNAATCSLVTLSAVCRYWWQTVTYRRSNARRLHRYFKQLCLPFSCNSRPVTSLRIDCELYVSGMVAFDSKLYVVYGRSNTINVYDLAGSSSYDVIEQIRVPGLLNATDLVVCCSKRCLFAADLGARCIRRVNLLPDNVVDQTDRSPLFTNLQYLPNSLSVQSERLLVTAFDGDALYVYDINDVERRSQRISLPDYMSAFHAVETSRETFVVAHKPNETKAFQPDHVGVSELSADGHVLRVYKGRIQIDWPQYITTVNGHFLVGFRCWDQILRLNTDLERTQVLLADFHGYPLQLCYSLETGKLCVTCENSRALFVYNV